MEPPVPLRILVIEDYESDFELLKAHLRRGRPATFHRVQDEAGLRGALNAGLWDLVISDYNLPGFGAPAALAICREFGLEAPFILMSGAIGEEKAAEAMRLGATDFVPKDRPGRLIPAIERSLETVATRRAHLRAEALLADVAAHVPGAVFQLRTDATGRISTLDYLSGGAAPLFGIDPSDARARPEALWERFADGERGRFLAAFQNAARTGQSVAGQFRISHAEGERWIQVGASPRADEGALAWSGLVTDITALKAAEAELRQSEENLRNLTAHLERVKEEERARIARDVHDELGGLLTAMRMELAQLPRQELSSLLQLKVEAVEGLLSTTMKSAQAIARALRPGTLDQGLVPALQWQARDFEARHGVAVRFETNEPELTLDDDRATALFRISQEALTNIAKHAHAKAVEITLFADRKAVNLEIRDDGRGMMPAQLDKTGSFGVFGMHERVRHLGGWLEIDGEPGSGTTLMASIPRSAKA